MLLCVNVSNQDISLGVYNDKQLLFKTSVSTSYTRTYQEYAAIFKSVFSLYNFNTDLITGVIAASVVPSMTSTVKEALNFIYKGKIYTVGPKLKNGLKIKSDNPQQIGANLICQSVAVCAKYPMPCLLISMGTALSMFALDKDKTFIGGSILPGVKLSAKALSEHAALLPQIDLTHRVKSVIGTNSAQNIQSGLIIGTACTIEGMVRRFKEELGDDLTCVATGDISREILYNCRCNIIYDENLIFEGLRIIYEKNAK